MGSATKPSPSRTFRHQRQEEGMKTVGAPVLEDVAMDGKHLSLRVGRIVSAEKHPDAHSLVVVRVDAGEASRPMTVVSGLLKLFPLEQVVNRAVVLLCNLRPAKMRGVLSQALVMCATSPEKVEIVDPPRGAQPGDRVTFLGYLAEPERELFDKKKEQVLCDLCTDGHCVATYKGAAFIVAGKGVCRAQTLSNCTVK